MLNTTQFSNARVAQVSTSIDCDFFHCAMMTTHYLAHYQCNSLDAKDCSLKHCSTVGCCTISTENHTPLILGHPCKVNSIMLECHLIHKHEVTTGLLPSCNHIQKFNQYLVTKTNSTNMQLCGIGTRLNEYL